MTGHPEIELPVDTLSIARLHGHACIVCGTTTPPLRAAGHVNTRGSDGLIAWPVVACKEHHEDEEAETTA